jgi:hypothetical protein
LTPLQWAPVVLQPQLVMDRGSTVVRSGLLHVVNDLSPMSPLSHLMYVAAIRADEGSDRLVDALSRAKPSDLGRIAASFDLTRYLRGYGADERIPTWFLRSFTRPEVLAGIAKRLHAPWR